MKLEAGTKVADNLRLVRLLGEGGMGSVWVADHLTLDTQVAVKFISAKLAADDDSVLARFRREAKAAAQIKSPHVVRTFDQGVVEDGTPYIVMELLEGESLKQRLTRAQRLGLAEVSEIVAQVAKALTEAHELGMVHRDIKPDNIFLTRSGGELLAKVLDFGVAKDRPQVVAKDDMTATGAIIGTPRYMSPAQLEDSKNVGPDADLWALAVVAYRAVTDQAPFSGSTAVSLFQAMMEQDYPPPSTLRPHAGSELDAFFRKALCPEVDARFATAKELSAAFARAVEAVGEETALVAREEDETVTQIAENDDTATGLVQGGSASGETPTTPRRPAQTRRSEPAATDDVVAAKAASTMGGVGRDRPTVGPAVSPTRTWLAVGLVAAAGLAGALVWNSRGEERPPAATGAASVSGVATHGADGPGKAAPGSPDPVGAATPSAATSAAGPRGPLLFPCADETGCKEGYRAWCNTDQKRIACCTKGLVAAGEGGICGCPPGGTDAPAAEAAGCSKTPKPSKQQGHARIQAVVRAGFPRLRECYEAGLGRNAKLTATITIFFEITPHGDVFDARLEAANVGDVEFQKCALEHARGFRFDPPHGGAVTIGYPIGFTPD